MNVIWSVKNVLFSVHCGTGVFKVINSGIHLFCGWHPSEAEHVTDTVLFPAPDNFARVEGLVSSDVVLQFLLTSHFTYRCGGRLTFLES